MKMLMNNEFKADTSTGNPTKNYIHVNHEHILNSLDGAVQLESS